MACLSFGRTIILRVGFTQRSPARAPAAAPALLALPVLLALGACAQVGPEYTGAPASAAIPAPSANGPLIGATEPGVSSAPLPPHWWRLYQDPALDDLVGQALAANNDLKAAAANLRRAQAVVREAGGAALPTIGVSGGPSLGHASGAATGLRNELPSRVSYDAGISVSYQVDLFGRIDRSIAAAQADASATQAAYEAARMTVVADTVRAYADLCSAHYQAKAAADQVALQQRSLDLTDRLASAGRGTAFDRVRAAAQLDTLRATLPGFAAQRRVASYRLAALTGRTPAEAPEPACDTPPHLAQPIPAGDGAALLRRRPDIRQAERTLAAATARIGVATADLYPTIALGLSAGSTGPATRFLDSASYRWSLGPLISWTLPNTGVARARITQAEANGDASLARFDGVVLGALREAESALTVYARELDRNAALRAARDQSAVAAQQANELYARGRENLLTVLDAGRTLASADAALAASDSLLSTDQIAVFLALGGGWEG